MKFVKQKLRFLSNHIQQIKNFVAKATVLDIELFKDFIICTVFTYVDEIF